MKNLQIFTAIFVLIAGLNSCESDQVQPDDVLINNQETLKGKSIANKVNKATGSVEIVWKGGEKGGEMGNKPDALLCFFTFNAHEGNFRKAPKGNLTYTVLNPDSILHREITASVKDVFVDVVANKAWIIGVVVSDTKGCAGNGGGGHDEGCSSGGHDDTEGGCSDDTSHDGGCSHEDTGTETDGGCSDVSGETHDDSGGCSGGGSDMGGMGEDGSMGGSSTKGNPVSGKNCRIGQIIAVKLHDGGSPGAENDGVTWKWFAPDGQFVPAIENMDAWPHLCKKTIIGGNIVIHD